MSMLAAPNPFSRAQAVAGTTTIIGALRTIAGMTHVGSNACNEMSTRSNMSAVVTTENRDQEV